MYHSSRLSTVTWRKKLTVHTVRHRQLEYQHRLWIHAL